MVKPIRLGIKKNPGRERERERERQRKMILTATQNQRQEHIVLILARFIKMIDIFLLLRGPYLVLFPYYSPLGRKRESNQTKLARPQKI